MSRPLSNVKSARVDTKPHSRTVGYVQQICASLYICSLCNMYPSRAACFVGCPQLQKPALAGGQ